MVLRISFYYKSYFLQVSPSLILCSLIVFLQFISSSISLIIRSLRQPILRPLHQPILLPSFSPSVHSSLSPSSPYFIVLFQPFFIISIRPAFVLLSFTILSCPLSLDPILHSVFPQHCPCPPRHTPPFKTTPASTSDREGWHLLCFPLPFSLQLLVRWMGRYCIGYMCVWVCFESVHCVCTSGILSL